MNSYQRYKVTIEYDGTNYVGFQIQPNGKTIQSELEKALKTMSKGYDIKVIASGRTDSKVHALGQVIHFDYPSVLPEKNVQKALNSLLPTDIRIKKVEKVSEKFHARYHTKSKQYKYIVDLNDYQSAFSRNYALHHPYKTDVKKIQRALQEVIGTHDFTSFCSTKTDKENKVRTIYKAEVYYHEHIKQLVFLFKGDGFLYNMVRILVGTALQIGDGLKPTHELKRLLEVKDRNCAGPTALSHGLYLDEVLYKDETEWYQTYEENKGLSNECTTNFERK